MTVIISGTHTGATGFTLAVNDSHLFTPGTVIDGTAGNGIEIPVSVNPALGHVVAATVAGTADAIHYLNGTARLTLTSDSSLFAGDDGISANGVGHNIVADGSIRALDRGFDLTGPSARITLNGSLSASWGIVTEENSTISVNGSIDAGVYAIFAGGSGGADINVTGTITAREHAIHTSGSGNLVSVSGIVRGDASAVEISDSTGSSTPANTLAISASGIVAGGERFPGGSTAAAAVLLRAKDKDSVILNDGQIIAELDTNFGERRAIIDAASATTGPGFDASQSGNLSLTNSGLIDGDIIMGAGEDFYDGALGSTTKGSVIDLGAGDDTLIGGAAAEFVIGGFGDDDIDGGGGRDTASYRDAALTSGVNVSLLLQGIAQDTGAAGFDDTCSTSKTSKARTSTIR